VNPLIDTTYNAMEDQAHRHPPPNNIPYLIAVVAMSALGVISVVTVLILRPQADNAALFAAIAGFIAPTTMALLAFMKTQETHVLVNGRMDEFKRLLQANALIAEADARHKERKTEHPAV